MTRLTACRLIQKQNCTNYDDAALVITGAMKGLSRETSYQELGFETT